LGINDRTGTIETGKEADMLLLDKNPLEDIRNTRTINGVFAGGNWYDKKAIDKMLEEARKKVK
jgi:imidazolonepropionase-like amidohydrolase